MSRPHYNRKPTGSWRDSGDRKPLLPEVDPNWRRRRVQRDEPGNVWVPIAIGLGVLGLAWYLRSPAPLPPLQPVATAPPAVEAPQSATDPRMEEMQRALQEQAEETHRQAENTSSINGKTIRRCRYQVHESIQTQPCTYPWVEVVSSDDGSRWQRVQEQEQVRLAAEARLAEEQRRFQAAAGIVIQPAVRSAGTPARGPNSLRCADAKTRRDEAYRIVGNQRTFEFIRQWQDIIYDACK